MSEVYYDYDDVEEEYYQRRRRSSKLSGLGIASLIMAIGIGFSELALLVTAGILAAKNPDGIDEDSPTAMIIGLLMMGGVAASLVGAAIGAAGLVQQRRDKVLPMLGLGLNLAVAIGISGLICAGLMLPD